MMGVSEGDLKICCVVDWYVTMDLPDARSLSPESLELLRRLAVRAVVELDMTQKEVAVIFNVSGNAVGKWCAAYRENGVDALDNQSLGRPLGVGRTLTPSEETILQAIVLDATPEAYDIPFSTWTRKAVQALIRKRYGIDLSLQGVGNYFHRWKMTPQKPARHAREQDPDEVREFEEETLPKAVEKADQEDASLHFADETGSQVGDQIGTSYGKIGQTPVLDVPKTRIKQSVISSVTPDGEMTYRLFSGTLTATKFIDYLEELVGSSEEKIYLVVDQHPAHKAGAVEAWVDDHADQIELVWLPRYSPEYNPDEVLNNDMKTSLKNKPLPEDTADFADTIRGILEKIASLPERIQGYFRYTELDFGTSG